MVGLGAAGWTPQGNTVHESTSAALLPAEHSWRPCAQVGDSGMLYTLTYAFCSFYLPVQLKLPIRAHANCLERRSELPLVMHCCHNLLVDLGMIIYHSNGSSAVWEGCHVRTELGPSCVVPRRSTAEWA